MTSRNLASGFVSAITGAHAQVFPLLEIGFGSGTVYLCGLAFAVTWNGNTYQPGLGLMNIAALAETPDSWEGLQVTLGGVTTSSLSLGLAEPMQGRTLILRLAALDAGGALHVDSHVWSGLMDAPVISDGADGASVTLRAEHKMATWDRPRVKRYTDAQLQADHPGDLGLQFVAEMEQKRIVWPSAEFFKQ